MIPEKITLLQLLYFLKQKGTRAVIVSKRMEEIYKGPLRDLLLLYREKIEKYENCEVVYIGAREFYITIAFVEDKE